MYDVAGSSQAANHNSRGAIKGAERLRVQSG